ncbi:uncharacterized protein LOC141640672 isoform X1 [Silene latifolia]|uniref:uncharacterized protein LOC141640672 isoform X1 n=1 Tax=Silene latifolia TaxID=37657 RepID=UPI003D77852E
MVTASSSSTSPPSVVPTSSLTCTYCTKPGHDYERCYQQIGYPTRGRGRGRSGRGRGSFSSGRGQQQQHAQPATQPATANTVHATRPEAPIVAASSASSSDVPALSSDQVQQLLTLLDNNFPSSKLSGKQLFLTSSWLLDSRASHHLTGILDELTECVSFSPCPVSLPDDVLTVATMRGMTTLGSLVLRDVLYVPKLKCNLISIGQLISALDCLVTFTDRLCIIQDRNSRMQIGLGEFLNGMYYYRPMTQ